MNDLDFKHKELDTKSASFCAAKWYNATIWLGSGQTTSCHHPLPHAIDLEEIKINPSALHNTAKKKAERLQMQKGERPAGCEYCWKIEDMATDAVSDRVYKSKIYPIELLNEAYTTPYNEDVNLRTLEIAFDRTCQFACSYCNPAFSTTWVNDIKRNGAYTKLVSDGRNHFTHAHDSSQLFKFNEFNPYVDAFFKWWESDLHKTLQELRITGGEPLMSGETWKLIDWFKENQGRSTTRLAINSNLGMSAEKLEEFIERIDGIPHLDIYTSNEATGAAAEYIRDGLDYTQWLNNVERLLETTSVKAVHVMCTINALCLDTLPEFLTQLIELKQVYGTQRLNFTLNILRFPSFQSPLVLPPSVLADVRTKLIVWEESLSNKQICQEFEMNHVRRLIDYLKIVKSPHSGTFDMPKLLNDFREFFSQYDVRRGKDFAETFPYLKQWYNSL
jgi:pyruvate-formate lyase-activating enzyme